MTLQRYEQSDGSMEKYDGGDWVNADVVEAELQLHADRISALEKKIADIREAIEQIVITEETDRGVIMLSSESSTYYDKVRKCQIYKLQHFSELGEAMIALWKMTEGPTL